MRDRAGEPYSQQVRRKSVTKSNVVAVTISALTVAALAGCTNDGGPRAALASIESAPSATTDRASRSGNPNMQSFVGPASERLEVGESAKLLVGVHCGLRYAQVDGSVWQVVKSDRAYRGGGASPLIEGLATREVPDVVVFESDSLQEEITLRPVPQPKNYVCF